MPDTCDIPDRKDFVIVPIYDSTSMRPVGYMQLNPQGEFYQTLKWIEQETGEFPKVLYP